MRVLAWPATSSNPYIDELYETAAGLDPDLEVVDFRPLTAWRTSADVVHVHWPEIATQSPSLAKAVAKSILVLGALLGHRLGGGAIVWTCHNLRGHERPHPLLDRWFLAAFERLTSGVIHLTEQSAEAMADHGRLGSKPATVAPHGRYATPPAGPPSREDARRTLGLDPSGPVLATVGFIRPYKQIPALIEAFAEMSADAHLIVAGEPQTDELGAEVRSAAAGVGRLLLDDRWLTDDEITIRVRAADAVVLGYREVHNSGVALLALGLDRPVAVTPSGAMADLAGEVGPSWIFPIEGDLDGATLDEIVRWAADARAGSPDLRSFSPTVAAERTLAFYRLLTG